MSLKITSLGLSVSLASQMILTEKPHHGTLVEPPHTHQEPRFPGQTVSVSSPAVSGSNVASQTYSVDAHIADADLVLPFGGLLTAADRRGAHAANLCTVHTGAGTAYVLAVQLGVPLPKALVPRGRVA